MGVGERAGNLVCERERRERERRERERRGERERRIGR